MIRRKFLLFFSTLLGFGRSALAMRDLDPDQRRALITKHAWEVHHDSQCSRYIFCHWHRSGGKIVDLHFTITHEMIAESPESTRRLFKKDVGSAAMMNGSEVWPMVENIPVDVSESAISDRLEGSE